MYKLAPCTQDPLAMPVHHRPPTSSPRRPPWPLALLLAGLMAPPLPAQDEASRLEALRERIAELSQSVARRQAEHDTLSEGLRLSELKLASLRIELERIDTELANVRDTLAGLESERAEQLSELAEQRELLSQQARASYMLFRVDYLHVLLSQKDPGAVVRSRAYHRYVSRARAARIAALREQLDAVLRLQAQTAERRARLDALQSARGEAMAAVQRGRAERAAALARVDEELSRGGARLERLRRDEQALAELVAGLEREMAELAIEDDAVRPFAEQRGALPWPAVGKVGSSFGAPRGDGSLDWQGVLIDGERGAPVQAVARGRVAFADWLRGFGLMAIVDHGDGFMSLYGHNETLARETGDWVNAGDVLGTVGDSGGLGRTALYFEIRHDGRPQDPDSWLASR